MEKTKIDWCDSTWNPVTGCLHNCEYCYARGIASRFKGGSLSSDGKQHMPGRDSNFTVLGEKQLLAELNEPVYKEENGKLKIAPYPYGFYPTFHRYRLEEYQNKKGRNIFVCSMADLFGEWIPEEWQEVIFLMCNEAKQHNYLFLTKSPENIPTMFCDAEACRYTPYSGNFWFGTTITCQRDLETRIKPLMEVQAHTYLSIEPLLEKLDLSDCILPEWVIIGAETGKRKDKIVPKKEWIEHVVDCCRRANVPVFMKSSLEGIWDGLLIQEFPEGLKK